MKAQVCRQTAQQDPNRSKEPVRPASEVRRPIPWRISSELAKSHELRYHSTDSTPHPEIDRGQDRSATRKHALKETELLPARQSARLQPIERTLRWGTAVGSPNGIAERQKNVLDHKFTESCHSAKGSDLEEVITSIVQSLNHWNSGSTEFVFPRGRHTRRAWEGPTRGSTSQSLIVVFGRDGRLHPGEALGGIFHVGARLCRGHYSPSRGVSILAPARCAKSRAVSLFSNARTTWS